MFLTFRGGPGIAMNDMPLRLTAEMGSFRLLVLAFIREYIEKYSVSPSQGEIRNALHTTRSRVRDALRSLEQDKLIHRRAGARGISLPSMREDAIRLLRDLGSRCDRANLSVQPIRCRRRIFCSRREYWTFFRSRAARTRSRRDRTSSSARRVDRLGATPGGRRGQRHRRQAQGLKFRFPNRSHNVLGPTWERAHLIDLTGQKTLVPS